MKNEITTTERSYYNRLTTSERRIYEADTCELGNMNTRNDYYVAMFADVARLLNELHRLHEQYNINEELLYDMPNNYARSQAAFESRFRLNEELFVATIAVGNFSSVLSQVSMNECDALYVYLATLKMNRFDWLVDNYDVEELIDNIVSLKD